jgi:hypothetical protein
MDMMAGTEMQSEADDGWALAVSYYYCWHLTVSYSIVSSIACK